jgi:hypothetical protein
MTPFVQAESLRLTFLPKDLPTIGAVKSFCRDDSGFIHNRVNRLE